MKKVVLLLLMVAPLLDAQGLEGSIRSGIFMGSGLWSQSEFSNPDELQFDYPNLRLVNQLRLGARYSKFSWRINGLNSTGFAKDSTLSETKLYTVMGRYDFARGYLKAGRIPSLNRWYWGSYDGGAAYYKLGKRIRTTVWGGLGVPYGDFYDSDNSEGLAYADISYRQRVYGARIKSMYREDLTRAGIDFWGKFRKLRFSGDYGYDFTNSRISDGGLNLFYSLSHKLVLGGNYRLFRSEPWDFPRLEFSYLTERAVLSARYSMTQNYYVNIRQVASFNSDYQSYVTYLLIGNQHFYLGGSYLTSDYDLERWGLTLGGKYQLVKTLLIEGAIAPVDVKPNGSVDHITTLVTYLRLRYDLLTNLELGSYWGLYNDIGSPDAIAQKFRDTRLRGQFFLRLKF